MTATNVHFTLFCKVMKHGLYQVFMLSLSVKLEAVDQYFVGREWQVRDSLEPGKLNVINQALISVEKILLSLLHIKLGLMKQFVKALDPACAAFQHIRQMFPSLPDAKVSGGIFVGPQIKVMLANMDLEDKMSAVEKRA